MARCLAISGSLRRESLNGTLLRALPALAPEGLEFDFFPGLGNLPLYNQDLDGDRPPGAVTALREAIRAADGLVLVTPEYLHGLPGVVKNAIDWASRPVTDPALTGKAVVVLVATTGRALGFRSRSDAVQLLTELCNVVVPAPEVVLNSAQDTLTREPDGTIRITDPMTEALIRVQLHTLADLIDSGAARTLSASVRGHLARFVTPPG
ncbi:NADPH-dependent FMN reductase [Streptomyces sp. UNOB3_S3]|uniref:NADPH-dependent FMN reductase n=1 Tax=Streptomyces sp. UNOB3_S3 TaxID=2871682 RepID=UPI001E5D0EB0|nr:NAD(P)H-dependent oxidoreductase [Streptomyces sp. UNOB3_S3]MCC3774900.1 NAD(P)H-dependent oxidoreductase [Streptomyces sp. UNOB3_S3]